MIWDSGETKSIFMVHIGDYVSNDMDGYAQCTHHDPPWELRSLWCYLDHASVYIERDRSDDSSLC